MNSLCRSFFFTAVLLLFCRIGVEVQTGGAQNFAWEASLGCAESAGEEDSREFGNDELTGHADLVPFAESAVNIIGCLELLHFSEHVLEVVPPPPLS